MVIEVHEECWRAKIVLFDVVCISDSLLLNEILPNLHVQHCRIVQRLLFFFSVCGKFMYETYLKIAHLAFP